MAAKFRKGDRVRVLAGHGMETFDAREGMLGTVDEDGSEAPFVRLDDDQGYVAFAQTHLEPLPVAEATGADTGDEPKFKVGDRVKFRDDYNSSARGTEATVIKVDSWGIMVDGVHGKSTEQPSSLRLVAEATSGKFKVGDRVRNPDVPDAGVGIIEEIKPEGGYSVNYKDTWYGHCHDTDDMLVPAGITIQPGKFYRTRDGRKVGPMKIYVTDLFNVPDDIDGRLWHADGERYSRNNDHDDLIAEWVGEPSEVFDELERWMTDNPQPANDNSTAGFTIPLCELEAEPDLTAIGKAYADGYAAGLRAAA